MAGRLGRRNEYTAAIQLEPTTATCPVIRVVLMTAMGLAETAVLADGS